MTPRVQCTVTLPEGFGGEVRELTPRGSQPVEVRDGTITTQLDQVRARVYRGTINR